MHVHTEDDPAEMTVSWPDTLTAASSQTPSLHYTKAWSSNLGQQHTHTHTQTAALGLGATHK